MAFVHGFYDRIRKDELLAPIFDGAILPQDWPAHLDKMCVFWSATLLRTDRYDGRRLPPHLAIPELAEEHFGQWLSLFRDTVDQLCPPEVANLFLDRVLRIAPPFVLQLPFIVVKIPCGSFRFRVTRCHDIVEVATLEGHGFPWRSQ